MTNLTLNFALNNRMDDREAAHTAVRGILWLALATSVVFPHTFQVFSAILLVATTALCLPLIRKDEWLNRVLLTYFVGVIATAIYIWVGTMNGSPRGANGQTILIYIVSPFMWIVMSTAILQLYGIERTVKLLIQFTWYALTSVAAVFYLFLVYGRQAISFLTEETNVNVSGGFAAANILVFGSLIFLTGGAFAQPAVITKRWARIVLPAALVLCALTSGRSALALSVPIGFLTGVVLRRRIGGVDVMPLGRSVMLPTLLLIGAAILVIALMALLLQTVDLSLIFRAYVDKVLSGGGEVRTEQAAALWEGILDTSGVGAGHGVGVNYIRNADYPWRYEIIPLATLYRVGVVGTLVYTSTFVVYAFFFLRRAAQRTLRPEDVYMVGGFLAAAAAAWTNPYIESFIFQWMFFLPVMSLAIQPFASTPKPDVRASET